MDTKDKLYKPEENDFELAITFELLKLKSHAYAFRKTLSILAQGLGLQTEELLSAHDAVFRDHLQNLLEQAEAMNPSLAAYLDARTEDEIE